MRSDKLHTQASVLQVIAARSHADVHSRALEPGVQSLEGYASAVAYVVIAGLLPVAFGA